MMIETKKTIGIIVEIFIFLLVIATTSKLYNLPQNIFPYSPPGDYEIYEQEWDGRSNPVVPTGEYEFSEGGYGDILFKNIISSILLCYIAYGIGKMSAIDHEATVILFWHFSASSLILYNLGWICKLAHWPYIEVLSIILFVCSVIAFLASFFIRIDPFRLRPQNSNR
jgi:hypothetical protein